MVFANANLDVGIVDILHTVPGSQYICVAVVFRNERQLKIWRWKCRSAYRCDYSIYLRGVFLPQ
jgi:hypothetical protein